MTSNEKNLFATYAIRKTENSAAEFASTTTSLEKLRQMIDESFNEDGTLKNNTSETPDEGDQNYSEEEKSFKLILENITKQLNGYFYLSFLFTDLIPKVGRMQFKRGIADDAKNRFELIEEYNGFPIYKVSEIDVEEKQRELSKLRVINTSSKRLKFSIILSLVSTYDFLFAELCRFLMKQNPSKYEGSEKLYSVSEILKIGSIDQIIEKVIDDEIDSLMNKSHDDQIKFFEENFHIPKIRDHDIYPEFIELFQRRNLIAHGDLIVNERYINGCANAGCVDLPEIGSRLDVNADYIEKSIALCYEMLVLMAFNVWRKRRKDEAEKCFTEFLNITFELLKDDQPKLSIKFIDYALSLKDGAFSQFVKQAFVINRAIAMRMQGQPVSEEDLKERADFSSSSPLVRLCLSSVLGKVDEAVRCIEPAVITDGLNVSMIRSWPAFQWVRTENEFAAKVEEVFGQPANASISIEDMSEGGE